MRIRKLLARLRGGGNGGDDAGGGGQFDPDERWSNVYREREKNSIYKWVGLRKGEQQHSSKRFLMKRLHTGIKKNPWKCSPGVWDRSHFRFKFFYKKLYNSQMSRMELIK
jgi:hypothetical protein